jgi:hypothetical protein
MGANKAAESSNITTFDIFSNYGKKVSVLGGVAELHYFESILDNTVRVTSILTDTGNRFDVEESVAAIEDEEDLKLTAGEKTHLVIEDNYGTQLKFQNDTHLRIKEVRNILEQTQNMVYTIDFYSKESIDNELVENRVIKRYDGKITDSVQRIFSEVLKTPKTVDIDPGLNKLNFIGNTEKPFHKLIWLAKRCVPEFAGADGNLAGYFFFETSEGFKFKSIDNLFSQGYKRKLIFNNTTSLPEEYDAKILDYSFDNTVDIHRQMVTGALFQSESISVDSYESSYRESDFSYTNQYRGDNIGGKESPKLASDLSAQSKSTRIAYRWDDKGFLPEGLSLGQQLERSKEINFDIDKILRQSFMRYNNLFTTKLSIVIPGDFSLHAGDLVHCDFPEISNKVNQLVSRRKSGLYMIVDICHFIRSNPGETFTRMNLVRESLGRKPF